MLGVVVYLVGCAVVAGILASLLVMLRPVKDRDETKPWLTFVFSYIFVVAAPYIYVEVVTNMYGPPMKNAVEKGYGAAKFNGPMKYYRITGYTKESARVLVVGSDVEPWGGSDEPVVSVVVRRDKSGSWVADSYKVLTSGRLNQDNLVLPPYF
jgi:hypothetical protein